jgi:putative DNA primase/helicase
MARAPEGRRNDQLNRSAFSLGTLIGAGMIDRGTVERSLIGAAAAAGLSVQEATATIKSGIEAGISKPRQVSDAAGGSVSSGSAGPGPFPHSDWPEPGELPSAMPTVELFRPALLPDSLRPLVMDIADRLQCPPDFPAVALMVGLGTVAGRRVGIRPKRHDDWTVIPNLWGGVVGRPGVMKTPAIREPLRALERLEVKAKETYENELADWKAEQLVAKEAAKVTGEEIRKALRDKRAAHSIARQSLDDESPEPSRRRFIANDPTVEKLGELLAANPNGILLFRDELTGFLHSLEREGREGSRAFYLEAWNGDGRFTYDRIGRGTIDIEAACVSILGGIQPGPLTGYMLQLAKGLGGDDGLMQRFQLLVWPDLSGEWVNVDREPDVSARRRIGEIFERLDSLDPETIGAIVSDDAVPYLRFDEQAQAAFDGWRADLERRIRAGNEHPAMEAHLSKYRSLVPSLALLCHLADGVHGDVTLASFTRAAAWAEYLESHARRVYAAAVSAHIVAARSLAGHIQAGDLPNPFVIRDIYRPQWSGLTSPDEASTAATMLVDIDWLKPESTATSGRHKVVYHVNPRIPSARQ